MRTKEYSCSPQLLLYLGPIVISVYVGWVPLTKTKHLISPKWGEYTCARFLLLDYAMVGYLTREGWGSRKPGPMDRLMLPVEYIVVSHTAQITTPCKTTDDCCATVRRLQQISMDKYSEWCLFVCFSALLISRLAIFVKSYRHGCQMWKLPTRQGTSQTSASLIGCCIFR